jgi:hypothetical protein
MAELDPEKVGRSGVDPVTGSVLSQEVRTALLRKSTINASVLRNDLLSVEERRKKVDEQNVELSRGQNESLLGFNLTLQAIRTDIVRLGTGLSGIALLLQQDALEDKNRIEEEQKNQRLLTEKQIRIGKENEIEQKIQNAVTEPVQRLVPKVNDIFGRIGTALGILFAGWLTNQVVQAIKASEEGNTKLFNEIRFNIIKNVGIAVGGLIAIRAGFSLIKRTIGTIASVLTKLLIAKPLALAASLIPRLGGRNVPTPGRGSGGGGKPSGGKGPGIFGSLFAGINAFMNAKNGEYVDTAMIALSLFGPGKFVKGLMGIGFAADQIAEIFGMNIFGKDPNYGKKAASVVEEALKQKENKSTPVAPKVDTPQTSTPVAPKVDTPGSSTKPEITSQSTSTPQVTPQETMMGEQKPSTSAPSPDMEKKFEQAWQYRNNPMARGRIEDTWNKMTPDQQQQAKTWAQTKGYDWSEIKLKDAIDMSDLKEQPSKTKSAEISPAQMSTPPREPQQVGELPEPKPSLTMIKTSSAQQQQSNPPLTSGPLSDVPLINSANPDNFYVLYSQLNYNVVM